ncbi:hypothetical protein [Microcella humidisoli]|uniref:Signal transduction histidine kinase subgroup 3 dimerisation and phosphoacceptor domain-containing protein n=1 Tax=Microcella humidisoli TaxID=2963406 RepID=A0ABY5FV12_9MICO|nr:hypothetical protein [Microcella humidisoli]UTT61908.1 hypothetical protein NNL39_09515 [Microcella humidisoli]
MTVREALGGPWAAHWMLLIAFLPPSTLLVLLRETVTPFPEWWWPLVSALVQHVVTGVVIMLGGAIARRVHAIIPVATILAIWALGAGLRGIVAGAIAHEVAGVDPEFLTRAAVWSIVSLVWVPPLVYAIAQFERRRLVIGALDVAEFEVNRERPLADSSATKVQQQLRHAIAASLLPALDDLQSSLDASRSALDRASVAELSLRLSQLHDDTADLLDSAHSPATPPPPSRATLRRALEVPPRRPWLTALLVGVATTVLVVFDAWRIFGPLAAIEVIVSTVAASLIIGVVPATVAVIRPDVLEKQGQRTTGIAALLGIFVATFLMLNSGIDPITWHGLLLVPLLAIGLTIASGTYLSAIVLADANVEADARLAAMLEELEELRSHNARVIDRERRRLSDLMHGPVQGRIAACIMALNFHASGDHDQQQAQSLTDSVLDHLRAVSRDLSQIAAGVGRPTSP